MLVLILMMGVLVLMLRRSTVPVSAIPAPAPTAPAAAMARPAGGAPLSRIVPGAGVPLRGRRLRLLRIASGRLWLFGRAGPLCPMGKAPAGAGSMIVSQWLRSFPKGGAKLTPDGVTAKKVTDPPVRVKCGADPRRGGSGHLGPSFLYCGGWTDRVLPAPAPVRRAV